MSNHDNDNKCQLLTATEQILAFASRTNLVREVKNFLPDFKRIVKRCFTPKIIFIRTDRSILSKNLISSAKRLLHSLCTAYTTCLSL